MVCWLSGLIEMGDEMQQQSGDCEDPPLNGLGRSGTSPDTHRVRAETATVAQGYSYAGMLAAERSRAGSLASALAFLLMEISQQ